MARRFGRNQRRQLREQLAKAERAHAYATDRYRTAEREQGRLRQRLEDWAQEIRHIMGADSAFNEHLAARRQHYPESSLRLRPIMSLPIGPRDAAPVWDRVEDVIEVGIFRCMGRDLGQHIALEIVGPDGALVAYGLSKDMERRWSPRSIRYFADMIATEMARHLVIEDERAKQAGKSGR